MPDVVLPVLNEVLAIPWVLSRMPQGFHPIVIDNGSDDGSGSIAASFGARVIREPDRGFGAACWAGLCAAQDDVVCFMDCDGSLDPEDLPLVADPIRSDEADLVLGARQPEAGAWPAHARLGNRAIAWEVSRRTGVHLSDLGPMRATRRAPLAALGMRDRRFGWPFEMVLRAAGAGWRIREVPVPYRPRTGRSKVTGTVSGTVRALGDLTKVLH